MRNISINDLDNINDARVFLMMMASVLQGWYLGADELDLDILKEAFGELHSLTYKHIENLKAIN
ncbi:hypothetical protein GZ989_000685 [Campylobacter fetus]|uniref:hypothetical protein n=1 Tax=Campylobacter fetus TaxID=196 RepID=UPI00041B82ED|nr:hypothetical protein [Campylobacter fetus]OCS32496.1 hypothetical protein AWR31_09845 [Campylobacter fetus subsp. venerealis]OCS38525.1 hypothetical protein CFVI02298_09860 [Campylobacter fetus subsp. venerealis cfvi02/298]KAA3684819.1 hypothetical protein E3U42_09695 [Campylobacter fetus subsp. fetus]OCS19600.1 hypothetical protein CFVI03596_09420 [Campylobacter fetus subsp. venerealis cfvi03/596]OCS22425.1 hypothetical protein CFVI9825_09765 [Campylobacter fetus subsp. venerealis cfvi9825